MKIIVAIAFYFLYWGVCFLGTGTDKKNLMGLRSYPEEVQSRVRNDPQLGQTVPKAKSTVAVLLGNFLLFTVVFSVLGLALKNVLNLNVTCRCFGTSLRSAKDWGYSISW